QAISTFRPCEHPIQRAPSRLLHARARRLHPESDRHGGSMQRAPHSPSRSEAAARGAPSSAAAPDVGLLRELGPPAMRLHVRGEAMLAERAAQHYSVVVLEVRDAAARGFLRALRRALQPGDEIGWLDGRRLALSLPLTDPATAAARASRLGSAARRLPR